MRIIGGEKHLTYGDRPDDGAQGPYEEALEALRELQPQHQRTASRPLAFLLWKQAINHFHKQVIKIQNAIEEAQAQADLDGRKAITFTVELKLEEQLAKKFQDQRSAGNPADVLLLLEVINEELDGAWQHSERFSEAAAAGDPFASITLSDLAAERKRTNDKRRILLLTLQFQAMPNLPCFRRQFSKRLEQVEGSRRNPEKHAE